MRNQVGHAGLFWNCNFNFLKEERSPLSEFVLGNKIARLCFQDDKIMDGWLSKSVDIDKKIYRLMLGGKTLMLSLFSEDSPKASDLEKKTAFCAYWSWKSFQFATNNFCFVFSSYLFCYEVKWYSWIFVKWGYVAKQRL